MPGASLPTSVPQRLPLHEWPASDIVRSVATGEFTCEAVVAACLARIAERDATIRAWTNFDPERALAEARALDRAASRGPLHGVPIGVKDVIDTFDMPTEMGSPIYRGHRPPADAPCVALLRAAGAVILGKTVTCEFAGVTAGATVNPHDETRTPGGSSSGSAAAVADCMVPVALGTQTGGSVLRPASYCGVIGYKPTYNDFSRVGVKAAAEGLDTVGLFARSLEDVALIRSVLLGRRHQPAAVAPMPLRIGFTRTPLWDLAQPETVAAVEDAAERLAEAGAQIIDVELPEAFAELLKARETINDCERAIAMAAEWHRHRDLISERLRKIIERGLAASHAEYTAAVQLAERCRAEFDGTFAAVDVLLAPCVRGEAPEGLHYTGDPSFQALWTLLHAPSLALPTAIGPNGLPVAIQLVGKRRDNDRLLAAARRVFASLGVRRPWRGHRARG